MDKKIYEKTRYQNIWRHKKNKNYVIDISKPIKTSISRVDDVKIFDINVAIKVRDSYNTSGKISERGTVATFWNKYLYDCQYVKKLKKNTMKKKKVAYSKYIKHFYPDKLVIKITEYDVTKYFQRDIFKETTDKQINNTIKELRAFFNWCIEKKYIDINPLRSIKKIKVEKSEIKFWEVDEFVKFKETLEYDIEHGNIQEKKKAFLINTISCIGMTIGDRIGETRTITFGRCLRKYNLINLKHTFDEDDPNYYSVTKTRDSERFAQAPDELFDEIDRYKQFLIDLGYEITDDTLIIFNHDTKRPYSDQTLRKHFKYYINKAGVPKIKMYDLRHSYVTNMMAQGFELYQISANIGHVNYATTVNYYGGLANSIKKKMVEASTNIYKK